MRLWDTRYDPDIRRIFSGVPISWTAQFLGRRRSVMSHISAHADYRHEDYFFARAQSRALSAREWDRSDKPLHSWSELLYPTGAAAGAIIAVLAILY
jgi:hypothetical protein